MARGGFDMKSMIEVFISARESLVRRIRGQTMTEYTLIVVAVAVVVFGAYLALGNNVSSLASGVDSTLTNS
jgi:Flp pilus assembly pilin Flp